MKTIIYVMVFLNLILGFVIINQNFFSREMVYVNIQKVYNEFEMKKEYEQKFKKTDALRKKIMDSLELQLKVLGQQIDLEAQKNKNSIAKFQVDREFYFEKRKQFEEDNTELLKEYDDKILKQLNQYVEDYGKQNKLQFVFGYTGNGELLYSDAQNEETDKIIQFINKSYKGLND